MHKIKNAIIIPLAIAICSIFALMLLAWSSTAIPGERLILTTIFVFLGCLLLELCLRQIKLTGAGLTIRKLFTKKKFRWDEITHLGSVVMGSKVYLLLTTIRGFYIISNNYGGFPHLIRRLSENLGEEKVDRNIIGLIEHPIINRKPVYSAWITAILIMAIIAMRYRII